MDVTVLYKILLRSDLRQFWCFTEINRFVTNLVNIRINDTILLTMDLDTESQIAQCTILYQNLLTIGHIDTIVTTVFNCQSVENYIFRFTQADQIILHYRERNGCILHISNGIHIHDSGCFIHIVFTGYIQFFYDIIIVVGIGRTG